MRSVPPRGSGWVLLALPSFDMSDWIKPTRYRVVVLTLLAGDVISVVTSVWDPSNRGILVNAAAKQIPHRP
jgi:hypothetical protein